jgi:hypothetical protein
MDGPGSLGVQFAEVMERACDQGKDIVTVAGDVVEEPVDRCLEVREAGEVLVVECLALEQPPQPLDQVEGSATGD